MKKFLLFFVCLLVSVPVYGATPTPTATKTGYIANKPTAIRTPTNTPTPNITPVYYEVKVYTKAQGRFFVCPDLVPKYTNNFQLEHTSDWKGYTMTALVKKETYADVKTAIDSAPTKIIPVSVLPVIKTDDVKYKILTPTPTVVK